MSTLSCRCVDGLCCVMMFLFVVVVLSSHSHMITFIYFYLSYFLNSMCE